jgi:hypothetical protein
MNTYFKSTGTIFVLTLITAVFLLAGCDSGGGGSDSFFSGGSSTNTGTVALSLTDGLTEDYANLFIWITKVSLLPADGGPAFPIFEYPGPGYRVDLLELRESEDSFLLSIKKKVPAGRYAKIILGISKIEAIGTDEGKGECDGLFVKLPSNEIRLNPRSPFWVKRGETIAIKLDVDAQKSYLHKAGNSGKCIFSPTVFVDIETIQLPANRCPLILAGAIQQLIENESGNVKGFKYALKESWYSENKIYPEHRDIVEVLFSEDPDNPTKILDEAGLSIKADDLVNEILPQMALVRGRINQDGDVIASLVVLGGVEAFRGMVTDSDSTQKQFRIELFNDSGNLLVNYNDDTLILTGCETEGDRIPIGSKVRVYGKFVQNVNGATNTFRAVVVVVKEYDLPWTLSTMESTAGGYNLIVEELGADDPIFLPVGNDLDNIFLKGDGPISADFLAKLVNCDENSPSGNKPRQVQIIFNDQEDPIEAEKVVVQMEELKTIVDSINNEDRLIVDENGKYILVSEFATIYRHIFIIDKLGEPVEIKGEFINLDEILSGDEIQVFGLEGCPNIEEGIGEIDFFARVVVVKTETYKN